MNLYLHEPGVRGHPAGDPAAVHDRGPVRPWPVDPGRVLGGAGIEYRPEITERPIEGRPGVDICPCLSIGDIVPEVGAHSGEDYEIAINDRPPGAIAIAWELPLGLPDQRPRACPQRVSVEVVGGEIERVRGAVVGGRIANRPERRLTGRGVLPGDRAVAGAKGIEVAVPTPGVHQIVGHHRAHAESTARSRRDPDALARRGIQRVNAPVETGNVDHAAHHGRRMPQRHVGLVVRPAGATQSGPGVQTIQPPGTRHVHPIADDDQLHLLIDVGLDRSVPGRGQIATDLVGNPAGPLEVRAGRVPVGREQQRPGIENPE